MFRYAEEFKRDDIRPGERYQVYANERSVITSWWCWGSLDAELKGKILCAWAKSDPLYNDIPKPSEKEIEKESYILGEDLKTLWFEDKPEEGRFAEL